VARRGRQRLRRQRRHADRKRCVQRRSALAASCRTYRWVWRMLADSACRLSWSPTQPGLATGQSHVRISWRIQHLIEAPTPARTGVVSPAGTRARTGRRPAASVASAASGLLPATAALAHGIDLGRSWIVGTTFSTTWRPAAGSAASPIWSTSAMRPQWRMSPLREPHHRCTDFLSAAELIVEQYERSTI